VVSRPKHPSIYSWYQTLASLDGDLGIFSCGYQVYLPRFLFPTTILFGEVFYRLVLWAISVVGEGSFQMDETLYADVNVLRLFAMLLELDLKFETT